MKVKQEKCAKMLQCSHCTKEFRYNSEKIRHESSHFPHFECEKCGKTFSFVSALRRHQKQHERTGSVQCKKCKRKFRDEVLLQRHIKYAHKGTFICDKCNSKFSSELALLTHMKTHRPEAERRFKCSHKGCTKTFNFSHHLKHHELTHTNAKQHFCSVCGKGFIQSHHLKTHLKSHDPNGGLSCSFPGCGKEFTTEYARKRHMATHKNQPDYSASSDTNSCDASTTIKEENKESSLCSSRGQTIQEQEYLVHLDKCDVFTDSKTTDTDEVSDNNELIDDSKDCSIIIKISNEEEVLNTTVEEWPSSPFRPNEYKYETSEFKSETFLNCDTKDEDNDESEENPSTNKQYFRNYEPKNIVNQPVIVKLNGDDFYKVEQRDMCEGCDCANICEAKISMYDVPNTILPPKIDIETNIENKNGIIKLKDDIDDDILLRTDEVVASKNNLEEKRFILFNTCKEFVGNCLVNGEGCLCAKMMAVEDRAVLAQEIDDITPQPGLTL